MAITGLNKFEQSTKPKGDPELLRLKDGEKVKVRPLQELDESSDLFNPKLGTADFKRLFASPRDFRREIVDTSDMDEYPEDGGNCIGRDLMYIKGNRWNAKDTMFINVLVVDEDGKESVKYMKNNMGDRATEGPALRDHFKDNGSVTDQWFVYSRKGSGQFDTNYSLTPIIKNAPELKDVEEYVDQLIDVTTKYNYVPYDQQRAYLGVTNQDYQEHVKNEVTGNWEPVGGGQQAPAQTSQPAASAAQLDW